MSKLDKIIEKLDPVFGKIGNEIHLLAIRDALMSMIPFLAISGVCTFFSAIFFTETSFIGKMMDPVSIANIASFFQRIGNGTISLMSVLLAVMIPYFMGKQRGYHNPLILSVTSLALFFVFNPLDGGSAYFGTQGALLAMIIGLTSSELFIKLAQNEKLKINVGNNVPEAVKNSFDTFIIIIVELVLYSLIATILSVTTSMEAIELISNILQKPLVNIGATLPGAIIYTVVQTILFNFGIHPGAIVSPIESVFTMAIEEGKIINYSFITTFGQMGGTGACLGLLIVLLFLAKRKELKAVGRVAVLPTLFNINEPLSFGIPIVFNPIMMLPFMICPLVNTIFAYIVTKLGFLSVFTNIITWSTPPFIKGYIASNGDFRAIIIELICMVCDIFIWLIFLRVYEKQLEKNEMAEV
ncbi:MAG: PTS sugar transporter subunit IIC [Hespellia sp.]|nr:PTS sugar transporter subunit IIC [Hespellia sp.]